MSNVEYVNKESEHPELSEFEKRKAMSSFDNLFKLAIKDPINSYRLITENALCKTPYPENFVILYMLGILHGILESRGISLKECITNIADAHAFSKELKPSDYLGDKRKYGRIGGANGLK